MDERTDDMSHDTRRSEEHRVLARARRLLRRAWGDLNSVFWANTPAWRALKSGALVFLGFFCWVGGSVLATYVSDLAVLNYVRAYGFLVVFWGPLTHLVVVPLVIRLRRSAADGWARWLARNAVRLNLGLFVVLVLVLGTSPVGAMTLDFQGALTGDGPDDVDPEVQCSAADDLVTCQVEDVDGIDHVVVTSGDRQLDSDAEAPYELSFRVDETEEVVGQRQFTVEVRDADGATLRRFVRTVPDVRAD